MPSYRTICRFRISDQIQDITQSGITQLTHFLKSVGLVDEATFIDGTKILADANKYSFVWKKNTIRFDQLNREKLVALLGELREAQLLDEIPSGSDLQPERLIFLSPSVPGFTNQEIAGYYTSEVLRNYEQVAKETATKYQEEFLDLTAKMEELGDFSSYTIDDGQHYSEQGIKWLANQLVKAI